MIQMVKEGEIIYVGPIEITKYINEGYRIDFEYVKELYNILIDILKDETNSNGFTQIDDIEILGTIYTYSRVFSDIMNGIIDYPKEELFKNVNIITKFIEDTEKLKRIRVTKIIRKILMDVHSNNVNVERMYKFLTENELFIYLSLFNYIRELIQKSLSEL